MAIEILNAAPHILSGTPMDNSSPSNPPRPWWSSDAGDREIDLFLTGKLQESEERSLDRMHEALRRDTAARRAVLNIKLRMLAAGVWVRPTWRELFLVASDYRDWAKTEADPAKAAKLKTHGDRCEALARAAHRREVEADAARKARKAKRRRKGA